MAWVKMYVAADRYGIISLKNQTMDEWHRIHHLSRKAQPPNAQVIDYAYGNTGPKANLRKMIVAHYAWEVKHDWLCKDEIITVLSERSQFIKELVVEMSRKMRCSHTNSFKTSKFPFLEYGEQDDVPETSRDVPETSGDEDTSDTSEGE